jgi:hypothetical protein
MSRYLLYTNVFCFIHVCIVSIVREHLSVLNVSIVCIRNTARSKSKPLLDIVDLYKFSTVHPREHFQHVLVSRKGPCISYISNMPIIPTRIVL